jgi:hypothetical protein
VSDNSNGVILTGYFGFSSITFGTLNLLNVSNRDIFIVSYDSSGNPYWATMVAGPTLYGATSVNLSQNSIYVSGNFYVSPIEFGANSLLNADTTTLSTDIYLAKYNWNSLKTHGLNNNNTATMFIYPNPTINQLQISCSNPTAITTIEIFDVLGRQVFCHTNPSLNNKAQSATLDIQLHELVDGVYYLRAVGNNINESLPFVVKR